MVLVRDGELLAALGTARSQYAATVLGSHALTETMLVHAAAIVRLECSFHCFLLLYFVVYLSIWGAKVLISFELRKFSLKKFVFQSFIRIFASESCYEDGGAGLTSQTSEEAWSRPAAPT